jgi:hypothetical protein
MPEKVFVRGIPDDLWRAIKARASLEGITLSEAIQAAIRTYLSGEAPAGVSPEDPWRGLVALGASGHSDVSARHDHYLAKRKKTN